MSNVMEFTPKGGITDETSGILTTNHLGASVFGDAGKDAQYLADISGERVVALDRPGTGNGIKYEKAMAHRLAENHVGLTKEWVEEVAPHLDGLARLTAIGRSVASLLLFDLAESELLPLVGLCAVEPIGLQDMRLRAGQRRYAGYQLGPEHHRRQQEKQLKEETARHKTTLVQRLIGYGQAAVHAHEMAGRQIVDIRHYQRVWTTSYMYELMLHIAAERSRLPVFVALAEEPQAAPRPYVEEKMAFVKELRGWSEGQAPFNYNFVPGTTHGSFDKQALYGEQYQQIASIASSTAA